MCSLSLQRFIFMFVMSGHAYGKTDTFTTDHIPDPNKVRDESNFCFLLWPEMENTIQHWSSAAIFVRTCHLLFHIALLIANPDCCSHVEVVM